MGAALLALQSELRSRFDVPFEVRQRPERRRIPTGIPSVDKLTHGGIPLGTLTEICGAESTGRTALAFALLAQATQRGECCAWIDTAGAFDPLSAAEAGADLDRVLWVNLQRGYAQNMGAHTAISLEDYLKTSLPGTDREYRDGELVERGVPDYLHGKTRSLLVCFFMLLRARMPVFPCVETRMRLAPDLVLIPDDAMAAVRDKLEQYKRWGVLHVWLADPRSRSLYTCDAGLREVSCFEVPELCVQLNPANVFDWA